MPDIVNGWYDDDRAMFFEIEDTSANGALRSTRHYTVAYVPATNEWHGDVIACGEWVDIDQETIDRLRNRYHLNELVEKEMSSLLTMKGRR